MCRSALEYPPNGKRCEKHGSPAEQKARRDTRNARRREQYRLNKEAMLTQAGVNSPESSVIIDEAVQNTLSETQTTFFSGSKAKHENGELVKLYHGSGTEFTSFDPATLGRGNDSWGNGFYFTTEESIASGYASDTKSDTANVKEFYLNLRNPLYADGIATMSLNDQEFTKKQVVNLLKAHPLAYVQPGSEDDMNPLGDYSPDFWDKDEWTPAEMDKMWEQVASENFEDANWPTIEGFYGREYGEAYLRAVHKETGYDGVVVDFGEQGKHYVAWFPEQMKLTSNTNPQDDNLF